MISLGKFHGAGRTPAVGLRTAIHVEQCARRLRRNLYQVLLDLGRRPLPPRREVRDAAAAVVKARIRRDRTRNDPEQHGRTALDFGEKFVHGAVLARVVREHLAAGRLVEFDRKGQVRPELPHARLRHVVRGDVLARLDHTFAFAFLQRPSRRKHREDVVARHDDKIVVRGQDFDCLGTELVREEGPLGL